MGLGRPGLQQFGDLSPAVRVTLAAFLDAVVIVDPVHTSAGPTSVRTFPCRCVRSISAGRTKGWSLSWCIRPMARCSSSGSSGSATKRRNKRSADGLNFVSGLRDHVAYYFFFFFFFF